MVKMLSFRFQHCFGPFTMLLVKGSSEKGLLRHLPTHKYGKGTVVQFSMVFRPVYHVTCRRVL